MTKRLSRHISVIEAFPAVMMSAFLMISVRLIWASGKARKILPSILQRSAICCTMSPKICVITSIGASTHEICSCVISTSIAVTFSAVTKP